MTRMNMAVMLICFCLVILSGCVLIEEIPKISGLIGKVAVTTIVVGFCGAMLLTAPFDVRPTAPPADDPRNSK